jgi:hypothetical protein
VPLPSVRCALLVVTKSLAPSQPHQAMKLLSLALLATVAIMGEASAEASAAAGQARRNLRQRQTAAAAASSAPEARALAHDDAPADDLAGLRRTRHGRRHRRGLAARAALHNDQEFGSRALDSDDAPPAYGPGERRDLAHDAPLPSPDEARALVSDDAPPVYGPGEHRDLAHDDDALPSPDEERALAHDDDPDTTPEQDRDLAHDDAPSDDHITRTLSNCDDFEGPNGSCK